MLLKVEPSKTKSSGKVCNIAHSLTDNLLFRFTWISGFVAVSVSLGLSQLVILKDCSNLIFLFTIVVTCLSYLLSNPNNFLRPLQSSGFGILPELLSFLNQWPAVWA